MTDQPENQSQYMNRLIRELGAPDPDEPLMAAIRRSWAKPTATDHNDEETDRG